MDIFISWRNIWRNKRRTFVILTAIFIGVSSMIFLSALMRGMVEGMVDNSLDEMTGHIKIEHKNFREDPSIENLIENPDLVLNKIKDLIPENTKIAKRITIDSVINTARDSLGVKLCAIDYEKEKNISFIGKAKIEGSVFSGNDQNLALMGRALCEKLNLSIGKRFVLTSRNINNEIFSRSYIVSGIFDAQLESLEKSYLFISLKSAEKQLGLKNQVTEISLKLPCTNIYERDLSSLNKKINSSIDKNLRSYTWQELLPAINAYISLFNSFVFIWYLVVFIAMGFGIVNTVLMAVFERMREFGLLRAIGMKPYKIFSMVLFETLLLLITGMAMGNIFAFLLIFYFSGSGIDLSAFSSGAEMWNIKRVIFPILKESDIISANLIVLILGLLVGVYPAVKASRFSPVETMKMN